MRLTSEDIARILAYGKIFIIAVIVVLCVLGIISLFSGCGLLRTPVMPTLNTESKAGEKMIAQEPAKTGSRSLVPVGEHARNVVVQSSLPHAGGKIGNFVVTKSFWPWGKVIITYDCLNCHKKMPMTVEQPKDPWWLWPAIIGGIIAALAAFYYLRPILELLSVPLSWLKRRK